MDGVRYAPQEWTQVVEYRLLAFLFYRVFDDVDVGAFWPKGTARPRVGASRLSWDWMGLKGILVTCS